MHVSDVTRNAGIRKTNRATRYVGPCLFAHAFNDVTYMINEYDALYSGCLLLYCGPRVAGCVLCYRVVTYYLYAQESFLISASE